MTAPLRRRIETALNSAIRQRRPLSGGNICDTSLCEMADGRRVVVKVLEPRPQPTDLKPVSLREEAAMLDRLRRTATLPVPAVLHSERDFLILDHIDHDGVGGASGMADLADGLAALHGQQAARFGYDQPTPIGPLQRPNPWMDNWPDFFRDHRLMFLGRLAEDADRLPPGCFARLERLCDQIHAWIPGEGPSALIHGDLWMGNVLFDKGRLAAVIDPAVYYADPEIELAFLTLFGGVGDAFFGRYAEHRAIDPLFFEERQLLYQVEPLLAHAWFFGGSYGRRVDEIVMRYVGTG